jgi:hypothetical protein
LQRNDFVIVAVPQKLFARARSFLHRHRAQREHLHRLKNFSQITLQKACVDRIRAKNERISTE